MAEIEQVVAGNVESSLIEQLSKAIHQLEAHKNASEERVQWMEIEEHFRNLEMTLKLKLEELETKEKEFKEKEAATHNLLAEREAAVAAKEQDMLDRVQELKDAVVGAIADARANHQYTVAESIADGDNRDSKVSSSVGDRNSPEERSPRKKSGENAEGVAVEVKPRPELVEFCKLMDAKGLLNYTMENHKKINVICDELSIALGTASEPARLVLDSLEGFYPPDETNEPGDKCATALQGKRKCCVVLTEAMAALLARVESDPGSDQLLNPETKQQAKTIADEWKPKLASSGTDAANGVSLEAEAFLRLLATFRIASEFDEEELCKLFLAVAQCRQAPELCHSLGLTHKVPGLIESLVNSGKQIDAVRFIQAFQLTERFPPVPLLKTYLKDLRRNSQGKGENTGDAAGAQGDVNTRELAALKAVIRCAEEHKLEADYPLDSLHKRVAQLDRSQADKRKRSGDAGKLQHTKKQKSNRRFAGHQRGPGFTAALAPSAARHGPPIYGERVVPAGIPERYHYGDPRYDSRVPHQPALYYHPQDDRVPPVPFNSAPPNYGGYAGGGLQPSHHQPYM